MQRHDPRREATAQPSKQPNLTMHQLRFNEWHFRQKLGYKASSKL